MNNNPPLQEGYTIAGLYAALTTGWSNWFTQVFQALSGWNKGITTTAMLDFPNIIAQGQQILTASVQGARAGDAVVIQSASSQSGVIFTGDVTTDNVVTIRACNFTTAAINPAAQSFRIIILQN